MTAQGLKRLGWFRFSSGAWASPAPDAQHFANFELAADAASMGDANRTAVDAVALIDPSVRYDNIRWLAAAQDWRESQGE